VSGKRVIVHSLDQARAAIAAAADLKVPVTLMSARGMASFMGPLWFWKLLELAARDGVAVTGVLDCADEPGTVMAALRTGFQLVRFTGAADMRARLDDMARQMGARVEGETPCRVLDLVDRRDAAAACRAFLAAD